MSTTTTTTTPPPQQRNSFWGDVKAAYKANQARKQAQAAQAQSAPAPGTAVTETTKRSKLDLIGRIIAISLILWPRRTPSGAPIITVGSMTMKIARST